MEQREERRGRRGARLWRSAVKAVGRWLARLEGWPAAALKWAAAKRKGRAASARMRGAAERLRLAAEPVRELTAAWRGLRAERASAAAAALTEAAAAPGTPPAAPDAPPNGAAAPRASARPRHAPHGDAERALVHRIREETRRLGRNNVTRTEAYRAVYFRHPELHWALLAHMVSRNGGWNMTDLQGELLPRLLGPDKREPTFRMLERANALIFHDAYPQLLLYEAGRRLGRDLSHLLPAFGVSRFMLPVWRQFAVRRDPVPLTVALIVNEQHYIEERVVRHPFYRNNVIDAPFFGMQALLQLNQVVFPYRPEPAAAVAGAGSDRRDGQGAADGWPDGRDEAGGLRLAGLVLERFADLRERIEFGKRLYALLYGVPDVRDGARRFARSVRHTGSRADYAPHLYAPVRERPPELPYRARLDGVRLRPGAERLYSPRLPDAWPDLPVEPPEPGDWFNAARGVDDYFRALPLPPSFEMTAEHAFGLGKIELAAVVAGTDEAGRLL